jgi:hypothetical protein
MASKAQIEANRRNGAKSRGPITPEGKEKASTNALKHGLRAEKTFVLSNESEDKFEDLHKACRAHFHPANHFEDELVHEIAVARWRLRRTWTIETNLLDIEMVRQDTELRERYAGHDEGARLASAFSTLADNGSALTLITRYETALRRSFHAAVRLLSKAGLPNEPNLSPEPRPGDPASRPALR